VWLDLVKQETGEEVDVEWRPFSLDQVNQKVGDDYLAWDEPDENLAPALWGHRAGIAAKRQGKEALQRFMPLLLKARHIERIELSDKDALMAVAKEAGLDVDQFAKDLEDRSTLDEVAASHQEAVNDLGVFGTPTLVFPNGGTAFLKMSRLSSKGQATRAFHSVMDLMESDLFIGEVKRPQPPWPKGVPD
jgi:hypothetical protein